MTKALTKAKQFVRKGIEKLNSDDQYIIGLALLEGKQANPHKTEFGKWRRDNGFGDLNRNEVSDFMWLAEHLDFYKEGYPSPRKARQAWMELNPPELPKTEIVLDVFDKGEKLKAIEVANRTGLSKEDAGKLLASLANNGRLEKPERGVYCLPSGTAKPKKVSEQVRIERETSVGVSFNTINNTSNSIVSAITSCVDFESAVRVLHEQANSHRTHYSGQTDRLLGNKLTISHQGNIGDIMQKTTHDGANGKVKVTVTVEVIKP